MRSSHTPIGLADRRSSPPRRGRLGVALVLLVLVATVSTAGIGAARQSSDLPTESALVVSLRDDGSARVTLVVPFDLATASERSAFEELRANATAQERRVARFATRLRAIADRAETDVDREMRVDEPSVAFEERADTGIVALSVRWVGLAATTGDELVLAEPFSSGATFERSLHVVAPAGYRLATVTPAPSRRTDARAVWTAGTDLEGFEARCEPADPPSMFEVAAEAPGFGVGAAISALLLAAGVVLLRSRRRR